MPTNAETPGRLYHCNSRQCGAFRLACEQRVEGACTRVRWRWGGRSHTHTHARRETALRRPLRSAPAAWTRREDGLAVRKAARKQPERMRATRPRGALRRVGHTTKRSKTQPCPPSLSPAASKGWHLPTRWWAWTRRLRLCTLRTRWRISPRWSHTAHHRHIHTVTDTYEGTARMPKPRHAHVMWATPGCSPVAHLTE